MRKTDQTEEYAKLCRASVSLTFMLEITAIFLCSVKALRKNGILNIQTTRTMKNFPIDFARSFDFTFFQKNNKTA